MCLIKSNVFLYNILKAFSTNNKISCDSMCLIWIGEKWILDMLEIINDSNNSTFLKASVSLDNFSIFF